MSEERSITERGQVLSEIANGIVHLHATHYGRGPTRARAFVRDEHALCILEDVFTTAERTLIAAGNHLQVRETRQAFQDAMADDFVKVVEDATGRKVRAFMSQVHWEPEAAAELFLFEPEDDGRDPAGTDGRLSADGNSDGHLSAGGNSDGHLSADGGSPMPRDGEGPERAGG